MTEASPALDAVLAPRSVAIIGASDDPNKVGGRPLHYMLRWGFGGRIYPINPRRREVQGVRAFPDLDALDEAPEAAVIAVPGADAVAAVRACAQRGVQVAIVMSSGFGEIGASGRAAQDAMLAEARAAGMRLVGPNSQGIANFANGCVLNFSTMLMEVAPADGPIAIISQSGAASVLPFAHLRAAGYGVRYLIASGNDADLGAAELACAVARDPEVKVLLVYVETLRQPHLLAEAAQRAAERGAATVLLKGGTSRRGSAAAQSHTGAIVGGDDAVDAFALRHRIWRAHDLKELVNAVPLYLQGADPGRGRSLVVTPSGAIGVLCADTAERLGLELAELSPSTLDALTQALPPFATAANPLDITAGLLGNPALFPRALQAAAADPAADMILVGAPIPGPGYDIQGNVDAVAACAKTTAKPVVLIAPWASTQEMARAAGLPAYAEATDALGAMSQYARHVSMLRRPPTMPPALSGAVVRLPQAGGTLSEHASLALLKQHGLPVFEHRLCASPEAAVDAFHAFGGSPVVVKGCSRSVAHKSEAGLVHLDLVTAEAVRRAAEACLRTIAGRGFEAEGVLVGVMVRGPAREFALGVKRDPDLGALLVVAEGGTLIELRRDVVPLIAPFTAEEAMAAVRRMRLAPLLDGYRGEPALDVDALARAAVAMGNFAASAGPRLLSVDVNPLLVLPRGRGVVAVDALVELDESK